MPSSKTKLPNWQRDPFAHLSKAEKRIIKEIEKSASQRLRSEHPNGEFALKVPLRLPGKMVEPESMTVRRKNRKYMEPHPVKMKNPVIYRGKGRIRRLEREREEKGHFYSNIIIIVYDELELHP